MKFSIANALLLSSLAVAAPLTEERRAAKQARAAARHQSNPPFVPDTLGEILVLDGSTTHAQYSSNWAGAVLVGSGYTAVTGQFTVPTPKAPSGGSSKTQYCASAWVGLDGDTCTTAILQTGIDVCVQGGSVSFDAWYEWYPDYAYNFNNFGISAGDVIKTTVTASSITGGTAVIENVSTGQQVTHTFTHQSGNLCKYNAEWIVEDFNSGGSMVPFANFGTFKFTGATATDNGATVDTSGAQILDIEQNNQVLTSSSASGTSVTVSYV
jgi:hypothetical protein